MIRHKIKPTAKSQIIYEARTENEKYVHLPSSAGDNGVLACKAPLHGSCITIFVHIAVTEGEFLQMFRNSDFVN